MPHRAFIFNIGEILFGLLPVTLIGTFDFDHEIIAHVLATFAGAGASLAGSWRNKTLKEITIESLSKLSAGYIIGGIFFTYFKAETEFYILGCFFFGGISGMIIVKSSLNILNQLEKNSWNLSKQYIKKSIVNFLGLNNQNKQENEKS